MVIPIFQGFLLFIIKVGMYVLWIVDFLTNFDLEKIWKKLKPAVLYTSVIFFGIFLSWSAYTNFFYKILETFIEESSYSIGPNQKIYLPILVQEIEIPEISAKSVFVIDRGRAKVLYERNSTERLVPASTVKLMTALVALDLYSPQEVLTVPEYCTEVEGAKAFFPPESQFLVNDLIYSMLVGSAGDSACVLASGKVNESEFVNLMNRKAKAIGMEDTRFSNPIGLDRVNGGHFSTARDLYKLANISVANIFMKQVVGSSHFYLKSIDESYGVTLYNTNALLWQIPGSVGIKTGTTEDAGEVLVYEFKDGKKDLVIIVMGSTDRFYDVRSLLTWSLLSYSWD